jgi:enterochelin esterase family protein
MNLLETVKKQGNPLIDGNTVTFVWEGENAPHLSSDLHGWEENPQALSRVKKNVWALSFELPHNAYLEYTFYDPESKERFLDPFNKMLVNNGLGDTNNFFYMPEAAPTPYTHLPATGLSGKVTRHSVDAEYFTVSKHRRVYLYHPPVRSAVPLLVVYDGLDYFRRGKLAEIVDNLIAAKRVRPLAIAFLQNGGQSARTVEYGCSEPTLEFLKRQVLPLAAKELKLLDVEKHPGAYGIMGASMGGLMSVYTALRMPEIFGKALSQAGAFELWECDSIVMQMVRHFPKPDIKLWLDCGAMDSLLGCNRAMSALLKEKDYDFTYFENGGAHNYTTWRDSCVGGLEMLFG